MILYFSFISFANYNAVYDMVLFFVIFYIRALFVILSSQSVNLLRCFCIIKQFWQPSSHSFIPPSTSLYMPSGSADLQFFGSFILPPISHLSLYLVWCFTCCVLHIRQCHMNLWCVPSSHCFSTCSAVKHFLAQRKH